MAYFSSRDLFSVRFAHGSATIEPINKDQHEFDDTSSLNYGKLQLSIDEPISFKFFEECYYCPQENWWLFSRTEVDSGKVEWFLKKNAIVIPQDGLVAFNQSEGLTEVQQTPSLFDWNAITKEPIAKFLTLRLQYPKQFIDISRFSNKDYYVIHTSFQPVHDEWDNYILANSKLIEYLYIYKKEFLQKLSVTLEDSNCLHFDKFPCKLDHLPRLIYDLERFGPPHNHFEEAILTLHDFLGDSSPLDVLPEDYIDNICF